MKESLANPPIRVNKNSSQAQKIYVARMANLKAAITCNHKKGIDARNPASKKALEKFEESTNKKQEIIEEIEKADIAEKKWKTRDSKETIRREIRKD